MGHLIKKLNKITKIWILEKQLESLKQLYSLEKKLMCENTHPEKSIIHLPKKPTWKVGDVIRLRDLDEIILSVTDYVLHLGVEDAGIIRMIGKATQDQLESGGWKRIYSHSLDLDKKMPQEQMLVILDCFELENEQKRDILKRSAEIFREEMSKYKYADKDSNKHFCGLKAERLCDKCGRETVFIRGTYPESEEREVCPTCTTEKLENIREITSQGYGIVSQEGPEQCPVDEEVDEKF